MGHGHVLRTEVCPITELTQEVEPTFFQDQALRLEILEGGQACTLSKILQFNRVDQILMADRPSLKVMIKEDIQHDVATVSSRNTQGTEHLLRSV